MKVIGSPAGRNRTDELRDFRLNQLSIPAVTFGLIGLIVEKNAPHPAFGHPLPRERDSSTDDRQIAGEIDRLSHRNVDPSILLEHIEHFIEIVVVKRRL